MAGSIVQFVEASLATPSTISAPSISVTAGNYILVFAYGSGGGGGVVSSGVIGDGGTNTYTQVASGTYTDGGRSFGYWLTKAASSAALTITGTGTSAFTGILVQELAGLATSPVITAGALVVGSPSGTDSISTGNLVIGGTTAFVVGISVDATTGTNRLAAAGTGFTADTAVFSTVNGANGPVGRPEHARTSGTIPVTWTPGSFGGSDPYYTAAVVFTEASAAGAIAGTAALTFGQSGSLKGAGALAGSTALTFAQTGAIAGQGALVGSTALVFGQTGLLKGNGALAGSSALVFGASGTLDQPVQQSTLIADGIVVRRKRHKTKPIELPPAVFIAPASFEIAPPPEVIARIPNFTSLAKSIGKPVEQLRVDVDTEIRVLMQAIQERDDDEALQWILSVIE